MQGDKIGRWWGGGEGEREGIYRACCRAPAPPQLCPPARRHPWPSREQWRLPWDAFPLFSPSYYWTTEADGHFQSIPQKGIQHQSTTSHCLEAEPPSVWHITACSPPLMSKLYFSTNANVLYVSQGPSKQYFNLPSRADSSSFGNQQ